VLRRRSDAHITEVFAGVRMIRSFRRERTESVRYVRDQHVILRQEMLAWWSGAAVEIVWSLAILVAVAALIWYGGSGVLGDAERIAAGFLQPSEAFTTGTLVTLLFYLLMLLEPLPVLATTASPPAFVARTRTVVSTRNRWLPTEFGRPSRREVVVPRRASRHSRPDRGGQRFRPVLRTRWS
jgi:hypothetical protein